MPGVHQQSVDQIVEECREVEALGIPGVILFGLPESKDARGTISTSAQGVVQRAIEAIRKANLKLLVITDVCLCEYTDHGHCGVIENGEVANDATLPILAAQALSHARAGADIVAPSDMMDGRVAAIRESLDEHKFLATSRFLRMPQNIVRDFTDLFARRRIRRRNLAIVVAIRWIPRTRARR